MVRVGGGPARRYYVSLFYSQAGGSYHAWMYSYSYFSRCTRLTARSVLFSSNSLCQFQFTQLRTMASSSSSSRRLPVLSLEHTLSKYLNSLHPFLLEDERKGGPSSAAESEKRVQWAKEFENGIGSILQQRLVGR